MLNETICWWSTAERAEEVTISCWRPAVEETHIYNNVIVFISLYLWSDKGKTNMNIPLNVLSLWWWSAVQVLTSQLSTVTESRRTNYCYTLSVIFSCLSMGIFNPRKLRHSSRWNSFSSIQAVLIFCTDSSLIDWHRMHRMEDYKICARTAGTVHVLLSNDQAVAGVLFY